MKKRGRDTAIMSPRVLYKLSYIFMNPVKFLMAIRLQDISVKILKQYDSISLEDPESP